MRRRRSPPPNSPPSPAQAITLQIAHALRAQHGREKIQHAGMSRRKLLGHALEFPPDLGTHVESEEYYLQKAADMERFAREAWTVVYYDMFTTAAENYRALAREAAMLKPKAPAAAEQ